MSEGETQGRPGEKCDRERETTERATGPEGKPPQVGGAQRSIDLPPGRTAPKLLQTNEHLAALQRKGLKAGVKGRKASSGQAGGSWAPSTSWGRVQSQREANRRAELDCPVKLRELGEDKPCLRDWEEWQSENEEWRGPREGVRKGRAGTPGGVGTAEGNVLTQDRLLGRVKETERTDQRQTGRQKARELSLEARVEGGA